MSYVTRAKNFHFNATRYCRTIDLSECFVRVASWQESTWGEPFSTEVQQSYRRGYYAAAAYSDDKFGELLVTLDDTGFTNSTLVIMTAEYVA